MLRPQDLRIGNLILNGIGEAMRVNGSTIYLFYESQGVMGEFNPIPITEEWIDRLGFNTKALEYGYKERLGGGYSLMGDSGDGTTYYLGNCKHVH